MNQALCSLSDIPPNTTFSFDLNNTSYIVTHRDNAISVYLNRCPHLGIPLEWEENDFIDKDSELIRCASHGALFLHETGECVSGPCYGQFLKQIPYKVLDDQLYINLP